MNSLTYIILLLFSALAVSSVAAYFSIIGLIAIFPAAEIPILTMGISLEIAKLVAASWVYRNWSNTNFLIKSYLTAAVIVLSLITSMGIYGFLSKAHLEHNVSVGDNSLKIEQIENKISREQRQINDSVKVISQLDKAVKVLQDYDRIRGPSGAIAVRTSQKEERQSLNVVIDDASDKIESLNEEKLKLETEQLLIEVEVGPLKYIAEAIYGDTDKKTIDRAVRLIIIALIFVFDPLAILLVIAANISIKQRKFDGDLPDAVGIYTDDTPQIEPVSMEEPYQEDDIEEETTPFNEEGYVSTSGEPWEMDK